MRVSVGVEIDGLERARGDGFGLGETVQRGSQRDEPARRQRLEDILLLRHEPDQARDTGVRSRVSSEHANGALRRAREPAEHAEHRRLARAVRPEQRGDSGADVEADIRHGDERAEPLRHAVGDDAGLEAERGAQRNASSRRYRSQQTRIPAAIAAATPPVTTPVESSRTGDSSSGVSPKIR